MADFVLVGASIIVVAGGVVLGSRRLLGAPSYRLGAALRAVAAVLLAVTVVAPAVYALSKSRSFQVAGDLVHRVETTDKVVALTFDDGPTPEYTEEVLGVLADKGVSATFYLTGAECAENPASVRAIAEAGHELGNHTYSHRRMVFLPDAEVARELERTDAVFEAAGCSGTPTFRPPGGKRLFATPWYLARHDRTTVTWDLEPDSGEYASSAEEMTESVMRDVRPGSIVLLHVMHGSRAPSRQALPHIIDGLTADGYRLVTVSELLELRGLEP